MNNIDIEVVYGTANQQYLHRLSVPIGTTVRQAVLWSNIRAKFPEVDLHTASLGIFGKVVTADTILRAQDRVEIYRPLLIDPKAARRLRVQSQTK